MRRIDKFTILYPVYSCCKFCRKRHDKQVKQHLKVDAQWNWDIHHRRAEGGLRLCGHISPLFQACCCALATFSRELSGKTPCSLSSQRFYFDVSCFYPFNKQQLALWAAKPRDEVMEDALATSAWQTLKTLWNAKDPVGSRGRIVRWKTIIISCAAWQGVSDRDDGQAPPSLAPFPFKCLTSVSRLHVQQCSASSYFYSGTAPFPGTHALIHILPPDSLALFLLLLVVNLAETEW